VTLTRTAINKDPTKNLTSELRVLFARWKNCNFIFASKYKSLYYSDDFHPRAYGFSKIHTPGIPFKLIISSIDFFISYPPFYTDI